MKTQHMEINEPKFDAGGSFVEESEKPAVAISQHAIILRYFFSRPMESLDGTMVKNVSLLKLVRRYSTGSGI